MIVALEFINWNAICKLLHIIKIRNMRNYLIKLIFSLTLLLGITAFANAAVPVNLEPKSSFSSYFENGSVAFLATNAAVLSSSVAVVSYNENNEYFSLKAMEEVSFIQILNIDGELEFQLPVHNRMMHLSLKDFQSGDYYLNILFKGQADYVTTMLTKK